MNQKTLQLTISANNWAPEFPFQKSQLRAGGKLPGSGHFNSLHLLQWSRVGQYRNPEWWWSPAHCPAPFSCLYSKGLPAGATT